MSARPTLSAAPTASTGAPMLDVASLSMRFGGLLAVDAVAFSLKEREIFAIIGPNGAGKTTVFNCISGFYRPTAGSIALDGKNISGLGSHTVARHGLVRTFQNVRLFKNMTVLENLLVAQHRHVSTSLLAGLFKTRTYQQKEQEAVNQAMHWLGYMGLAEFANRAAGNLAYGHQRRLEIARCMVTRLRVLMLDEPAAGLNPQEKNRPARADRAATSGVRRVGAVDRARHGAGDGRVRTHSGDGIWQADCAGHAGRGPQ